MADHILGDAESYLPEGQLMRIELEGTPIVVARVRGGYFAFGGNCTHYGAPLNEGVLKGYQLICPWHHACFDVRRGERLEPPALNDLPHYETRIESGQVVVTLPNANQLEPQGQASPADGRVFVIVGGGAAGNAAAEELRRRAYKGRILVLSDVPDLPVDRPNLSKDYLAGKAQPDWVPLRGGQEWYDARDIELHRNMRVVSVDPKAHLVRLAEGEPLHYDKLLLATGGIPRRLPDLPDLKGVHTLRTLADSDTLIQAVEKGKQVVIIGASFIGMEAASSLAGGRGANVTVIGVEKTPFDRTLGEEIGRMFQMLHESNGVHFRLASEVSGLGSKQGHVTEVRLKNGETIPADWVLLGVGVRPATDFLRDSGLALNEKDGSVQVDEHLRTSEPDIYAAGDIARFGGTRIEHWRVAEQHGMIAAHNMLGDHDSTIHHVPFFWTEQWQTPLGYVGHADKWDAILYRGSPADKNFIAFYVSGGKLLAAAGCGHDQELDAVEFILRDAMPLTLEQMRDPAFDLARYAQGG